ncbi:DUF4166 domain-containing protein [Pararhizobium sp. BT-229]|uniref:DUF4166 domain-containing protein n=1 Tax=Pararhizobium sp. BT-229 TaxID=2986923 RepID=UPI0021F73A6D|nr:DUF4166 domain-containing protein [Pararhizobium sp. BT-229]MCV9963622.1 DUF4166 domain-containing protein [Pararhizobium sp. BT-229]
MTATDLSLYERALGKASFDDLPAAIRALHDRRSEKRFTGLATVRRRYGLFGHLIGWLFGFPHTGEGIPTSVEITRTQDGETWERRFGDQVLRSSLSLPADGKPGRITESLGGVSFDIDLDARLGRLYYPVGLARIGRFPLPWFLTPRSDTVEHLTGDDRFYFSVKVDLPFVGHLVTYEGWLLDASEGNGEPSDRISIALP